MSRVGQRALVTGAASGIGHLAVQIAKSRGAKHFLLAEIRAEQTVDSSQQEFDDVERAIDVVLDLAGAQTPLGAVPPCATVAGGRGDLRMWTLPASGRRPRSATCSSSRPRRAGSHRRTRRPRPAACARRPALGCWRRPHGRTTSPPDRPSQARPQDRLNACRATSSTPLYHSFERKLAVRPGQPVTGGTQRGTMQGHRRNDHGEGPMNRSTCGCQHPAGRVCLYCVAQDPPVPRPARRRAGRGRLALRELSRRARP